MSVLRFEYADRRALAALVFVDALGARVFSPVAVTAPPRVRLLHKRPGEIVVMEVPDLATHDTFAIPPDDTPLGGVAVQLDIRPAARGLGARRYELSLPRNPVPAMPLPAASLFRPIEIPLLPAPGATPTGLVAALSVTLRRADDGRRIEGALLRLLPDGGRPVARALTDAAGEALLLVPGVPISIAGPAATVLHDLGATLDAIIDPALARFHRDDALDAARAAAARRSTGFVNPDDLETRLAASATPAMPVRIAAGRTRTAQLEWTPA
jgi:hypothetical protein